MVQATYITTGMIRWVWHQHKLFIQFAHIFVENISNKYQIVLAKLPSPWSYNHQFLFFFQIVRRILYTDFYRLPMARSFARTNSHLLFLWQAVVVFTLENMHHGPTVTRTPNQSLARRAFSRMTSHRARVWTFRISILKEDHKQRRKTMNFTNQCHHIKIFQESWNESQEK